MAVEICAPLTVPAVAAFAPVTRVKARIVSPEPVELMVRRLKLRRVSPVVAELVAKLLLMFVAVVTLTGSSEVPTTKPFNELTGPEKVVVAI
jgi:hypothetical protein